MNNAKSTKRQRNLAMYFIVVKGLTKKETAKIVGVTAKSVCYWAKKFNWEDEETKRIIKQGGLNFFMETFFDHLNRELPGVVNSVKKEWYLFLKGVERNLEDSG